MTRAQQNTIILGQITNTLKDFPNVQAIISAKFDEWFRQMVQAGIALVQQGQMPKQGGGGEDQGAAPAPAGG